MEDAEIEIYEPKRPESFAMLIARAIGTKYGLTLLVVNLLVFAAVVILLRYGKNRSQGPAIVTALMIPFVIGALRSLDGFMAMYMVITTSQFTPRAADLAQGYTLFNIAIYASIVMNLPAILVAAVGLFVQALRPDSLPEKFST